MRLSNPKPHPVKKIIKKHSISTATVAEYLDLSFTYTANLLNGVVRVTPENEEKLQKLIEYLEGESGK